MVRTVLRSHAALCCTRPAVTTTAATKARLPSSRYGLRTPRRTLAISAASSSSVSTGIFPAGKKQAKVQLPALFVSVSSQEAAQPDFAEKVESCIEAGATALVVQDSSTGGADLFKATAVLKEAVRGRVAVLIEDRTDIVAATKADGVVLTTQGVPLTVAKQILSDPSYLIGVCATTPDAAVAAIADGASFIVLQAAPDSPLSASTVSQTVEQTRSGLQIPLLASADAIASEEFGTWVSAGLDGVLGTAVTLTSLSSATDASRSLPAVLSDVSARLTGTSDGEGATAGSSSVPSTHAGLLSGLLGETTPIDALITREKKLLAEVLQFLEEAVPDMSETRLLKDALAGLEEPFLLVVVGEFNSGKSTVINALLGQKHLEEGILPTTNEISILKHTDEQEKTERTEDGLFVRYLPSELLRRLHVVDTPGTNVIVDRQQRLTEEFVPRSDLVLFIMSADRPFTESEVKFLRYIREWGKKVVFVLNKVDILSSSDEVSEVSSFVSDKARLLLGIESATVIPVAARAALDAKVAAGSPAQGGVLQSVDVVEQLSPDQRWQTSRFLELEQYMLRFLTGSVTQGMESGGETEADEGGDSGEGTRLKLQTPVFVADALVQAAEKQLELEREYCEAEVQAIMAVDKQLDKFEARMDADGVEQRAVMRKLLEDERERAADAVSATLQLSNAGSLTSGYVFGSSESKSGEMPLATALAGPYKSEGLREQLEEAVREHAAWVETNGDAQLASYTKFVASRTGDADSGAAAAAAAVAAEPVAGASSNGAAAAEGGDEGAEGEEQGGQSQLDVFGGRMPKSLSLLDELDLSDVVPELEGRVRDVVLESTSAAAGAALVAFILTAILPNTIEDILALLLAGALAYISVLSWPIKRGDIKRALAERFSSIADALDQELAGELKTATSKLREKVNVMVAPVLANAQAELAMVEARQLHLKALKGKLEDVGTDIKRI